MSLQMRDQRSDHQPSAKLIKSASCRFRTISGLIMILSPAHESEELLHDLFASRHQYLAHRESPGSRISSDAARHDSPRDKAKTRTPGARHHTTSADISPPLPAFRRTAHTPIALRLAISRAVKRQVFEWTNRESGRNRAVNHGAGGILR